MTIKNSLQNLDRAVQGLEAALAKKAQEIQTQKQKLEKGPQQDLFGIFSNTKKAAQEQKPVDQKAVLNKVDQAIEKVEALLQEA